MSTRSSWRKNRDIFNAGMREAKAVVAEVKAKEAADLKTHVEQVRAAEAARVRLTAEDIEGARIVKDEYGWHGVVRINAKSVTVTTPYSWTDRIPLDRIRDFRT